MEELLEESQNFLLQFINGYSPSIKNWSGVEHHLTGKYLRQMIQLNKYMLTESSTNYPYNKYFEPMKVSGLISRSILNDKCIKQLEGIGLSLFYIDYSKDPGGTLYMHYSKEGRFKEFIADCKPCQWGDSNKSKDLEITFEKIISQQYGQPELIELMRHLHKRLNETEDNINKVYNELTGDQLQLIREYTWNSLANRKYVKSLMEKNKLSLLDSFGNGLMTRNLDHVNKVKDEIRRGNIVYMEITNYYDPFNRDLYAFLIQQFADHSPKKEFDPQRIQYIVDWLKTKF